MPVGIRINDSGGSITDATTRTLRFISVFNVGTVSQVVHTFSTANIDFDGEPYILFSPSEAGGSSNFYGFDAGVPTLSVSGSTVTVTTQGIAGTVYLGVT